MNKVQNKLAQGAPVQPSKFKSITRECALSFNSSQLRPFPYNNQSNSIYVISIISDSSIQGDSRNTWSSCRNAKCLLAIANKNILISMYIETFSIYALLIKHELSSQAVDCSLETQKIIFKKR